MKLGMVGLPNSGKSTLFNALTESTAAAANYPFSTVDKNVGIVTVVDERLPVLQEIYGAKKSTNATIEFVDIAGLVKGSRDGSGLGNKFLGHIREMDGLVHIVRLFEDENIPHVDGEIDPIRDMQTIELELIFADMEQVDKRIAKVRKENKAGKGGREEIALLERVMKGLEDETPVKAMNFTPEEAAYLSGMGLLSFKPMIYVANISDEDYECVYGDAPKNPFIVPMREYLKERYCENREVFVVAARLEEELIGLDDEQKREFLEVVGKEEPVLDKITKAAYGAINLISFITAGPKEVRAWTIPAGTQARHAAGKIHSDIERGFIRAEIIDFDTLTEQGSYNACKDAGLLRLEGKEYIVQEGDIILFRFNV
ncbi:MAG: redox-regulated ATPase YchF [Clostridiales bacterium]|jgi:GTP-binding protein YchF|nr:redox-regulated ATPase YchF [Clostridiales bacterium]